MAFMFLLSGRVISAHILIKKLLFHQTRVLITPFPLKSGKNSEGEKSRERVNYKIMKTSSESIFAFIDA